MSVYCVKQANRIDARYIFALSAREALDTVYPGNELREVFYETELQVDKLTDDAMYVVNTHFYRV